MQQEGKLGGVAQPLLHAMLLVRRNQQHHLFDACGKALARGLFVRQMHQPRAQIALVGGVALREFLAALLELPHLPLRCVLMQPCHARERQLRRTARHDDLQSLI